MPAPDREFLSTFCNHLADPGGMRAWPVCRPPMASVEMPASLDVCCIYQRLSGGQEQEAFGIGLQCQCQEGMHGE